jgi:hypothetical protein
MASERVETRLRVADGLLVIALVIISLVMVWSQVPVVSPGILLSIASGILIILGFLVLIGKTRTGRLVRTHRRWKCILLIGVAVVFTTLAGVTLIIDRPGGNPALPLFPVIVGGFVAQLFESEATAKFTMAAQMAALGDRDAKVWKRFSLVLVLVGIVLGCVAAVAGASGNVTLVSILLPIGILVMVLAAAIWVPLRSRNRQPRGTP